MQFYWRYWKDLFAVAAVWPFAYVLLGMPWQTTSFVTGICAAMMSSRLFKESSNPAHSNPTSRKFIYGGIAIAVIAIMFIAVPAFFTPLSVLNFK